MQLEKEDPWPPLTTGLSSPEPLPVLINTNKQTQKWFQTTKNLHCKSHADKSNSYGDCKMIISIIRFKSFLTERSMLILPMKPIYIIILQCLPITEQEATLSSPSQLMTVGRGQASSPISGYKGFGKHMGLVGGISMGSCHKKPRKPIIEMSSFSGLVTTSTIGELYSRLL